MSDVLNQRPVQRIAIVSDIHGNLPALEAVAEDIAVTGVDRVIVNGDMVNRGPQGSAVLRRIVELGWEMTLGNHDDLLRMWMTRDPSLPETWFDDSFWQSTGWCAHEIAEAGWLSRIEALPYTITINEPGTQSILVSHGSPRHYREGYGKHLSDEAISEIVEMHPHDVLVGSHTHIAMERHWGRHLVLNSGAVGAPFNGDTRAQYLILRREYGAWIPEFRRVRYDREAALEAYEATGYLEAVGLSGWLYRLELASARSLLVPFMMWAGRSDGGLDRSVWQAFVEDRSLQLDAPDEVGRDVIAKSGLLEVA